MRGDREKCVQAGCDTYATKPIDPGELAGLVASYSHPDVAPAQLTSAYNLIRRIICTAAITHGKTPRRISFTRTCATILAAWSTLSLGQYHPRAMKILLEQIASLETPDRPGRIEPRVLKRRRHRYPLMRQSRRKLKKHLELTTRRSKMT